jgi:hypothetical protein
MAYGMLSGLDRLKFGRWWVRWRFNLLVLLISQVLVQLTVYLVNVWSK